LTLDIIYAFGVIVIYCAVQMLLCQYHLALFNGYNQVVKLVQKSTSIGSSAVGSRCWTVAKEDFKRKIWCNNFMKISRVWKVLIYPSRFTD